MSEPVYHYVVLVMRHWSSMGVEAAHGSAPMSIKGHGVGFMPVYASEAVAAAEWPGHPIQPMLATEPPK